MGVAWVVRDSLWNGSCLPVGRRLVYKVPYIVGANTEELAIVNLIAEREGIEARPQKRWDKFLGEFGSVAFAIAPLYSTFLHQDDFVSCHPACLLLLHCLLSRRVVNGSIQLPQDR